MSTIRRKLALAQTVALALLLGGCGGGGGEKPPCDNPAAPGCPVSPPASPPVDPSPSTTPPPPVLDVTGGWRSLARSWNFSLKQDGTTLSGTVLGAHGPGQNQQHSNNPRLRRRKQRTKGGPEHAANLSGGRA
jgi:hypothetical protein